jgi:iron-sulfur cluster repair protein YtfE (RIC family)
MQEHDALREKVHRIHTVLVQPEPSLDDVEMLLREFHHALTVHFSNEEEEGFFDEVITCAPRLATPAGRLCEEHRQLIRKVEELCRFATAGSPSIVWWRELSTRCHEFNRQLMRHEREENQLLQEAHQGETGTLD